MTWIMVVSPHAMAYISRYFREYVNLQKGRNNTRFNKDIVTFTSYQIISMPYLLCLNPLTMIIFSMHLVHILNILIFPKLETISPIHEGIPTEIKIV
jgi:hypothetical protein